MSARDGATPRLPAAERRAGILAAATDVFAERGYGAATTALIARSAGVNEALLFRHFSSKQGLYVAAIDDAWARLQEECDAAMAAEPDAAQHWRLLGRTFLAQARERPEPARLWARGLGESTGVEEIDAHLRSFLAEVHAYTTSVLRRSQEHGGVVGARQPRAEAWMVIAIAWLGVIGGRLGDVVADDFEQVLQSHREWLTGSPG